MNKQEGTKNDQQEKKEETGEELEFNKEQRYGHEDAIELCQKLSHAKFDATVELHIRLGIDPKKGEQQIRTAVSLPHGTGKEIRVAAFVTPDKEKDAKDGGADMIGGESLIEEIKTSEKTDFDIAVAEPAIMKDLSKIAKILGTRGLMPSPKNETVSDNIKETVSDLKKGKISFQNDKTANLHIPIGKVSFKKDQLKENYETVIETIKRAKPQGVKGSYIKNISLSSTMGPGIKVALAD